MKRPAYDSPSLPITWDRMEYVEGTNEYVPIQPEYKKSIDQLYAEAEKQALDGNPEALVNVKKEFGDNPYELKNILKNWVRNKNQDLKVIPTDSIVIKVDKEAVRRSGMMIPGRLNPRLHAHFAERQTRPLQERVDDARNAERGQLGTPHLYRCQRRQGEPAEYGKPLRSGRSCLSFHSVRHQ